MSKPTGQHRIELRDGQGIPLSEHPLCVGVIVTACAVATVMLATESIAAPETRPPVSVFAKLPRYHSAQLSPDGSHLAYLTSVDGRKHLVIQRADAQGPVEVIPPVKEADIRWFRWANPERLLISYEFMFERFLSETPETRLVSITRDGLDGVFLVKPRKHGNTSREQFVAQIQDDVVDFLDDEPDQILLAVDIDMDGDHEVWRINVATGYHEVEVRETEGIQHWLTDQTGIVRLGYGLKAKNRRMVYLHPLKKRWVSLTKTEWHNNGYRAVAFTEDPKIVYVMGSVELGRRALYKLDLFTGEIVERVFAHPSVDVSSAVLSETGRRLVGVLYITDRPEYRFFDREFAALQAMIDEALPETFNSIDSVSRDHGLYLVHSSNDRNPGTYYVLDRRKGQLAFLASEYPAIDPESMLSMQALTYKARDGLTLPAYLTLPKGVEPEGLPAVVLPHGGPASRDYIRYDPWVQLLASRGWAVLQPNYRGSSGYGRGFRDAGHRQWGQAMQTDLDDGVAWLIEQGIADPERICILGGSYGGYAALMGAVQRPDLYSCAISVNGVVDLVFQAKHLADFIGGRGWKKSIGESRSGLKDHSPRQQVSRIDVPVLVIHSKDDSRVPCDQARQFAKTLRKHKKDFSLVLLEDGGHDLDTENARLGALTAIERFLQVHLGGDSGPG